MESDFKTKSILSPLSFSSIQNSEVNFGKTQKWLKDIDNVVTVVGGTLQNINSEWEKVKDAI